MNTDKWIVEEQVIRKIPEMDEPKAPTVTNGDYFLAYGLIKKYEHDMEAYNQALASMPTYPRGDGGKWKLGQILTEDEFDIVPTEYNNIPHRFWTKDMPDIVAAVPKVEQSKETSKPLES